MPTNNTADDDGTTLVLSKATIDTTYHLMKPLEHEPMLAPHVDEPLDALVNAASEVPAHDGGASVTLPDEQWAMLYGFALHYDGSVDSVSRDDAQLVVGAFEEGFPQDLMETVETVTAFHESLMGETR